ncbi:MAG TPA: 50S ribosomal protein L23 [archaeon]|nr:50S ribosomal protein L23 [archaeon]
MAGTGRISSIVKYPSLAEKAVSLIESQNKLVFIVEETANKSEVKEAVEKQFSVKVDSVNILRDRKNRKKAFVKIGKASKASDLATKLGIV